MLSRRLIPSTAALVAFEAAARHASFTLAADELNLTQGAVSRQVAQLEAQLGVPLFQRVRQRVVPTLAGQFYAEQVRDILTRLGQAGAQAIAFESGSGSLGLAILPSFGARWLIPRMPDFFARHRDISINFSTRVRPIDPRAEGLDAAIMSALPPSPDLICQRFMGEELVPVAAPALIGPEGPPRPADLARLPLLLQETRLDSWTLWFEAQGLKRPTGQPALVFEQFLLVIRAAVAGLGCALVPRFLVREELASGELVILPGRASPAETSYYLVYPANRKTYRPLMVFRDWLMEQGRDRDGLPPKTV
ncbi:LysR family transcriptional regulator [Nitrospirillum sp. BR 11828]|uniref:LysR family transcriptional regulator n=1 Tax=Nitrospirillum sp. BR 11828 TaxID=3104325 RepID=UPI002ACACEB9|nr:LysR family transcriptional regulator [Nitrospirillum sp. BR 11828]MDZ5645829.1 LysR family transcriptional regulator [Nitrospirillum sp. BR 11828]